jgi:release factor glutamine methyltransferase
MVSGQEFYSWYQQAKQTAIAAKISPAEVDWLLREITGLNSLSLRLGLLQQKEQILLTQSLNQIIELWQKRLKEHVPVQYLVGKTPWRHFNLKVAPGVLIPRPETELLIDIVEKAVTPQLKSGDWVDLGTGSGAIALGLAASFPEATVHAIDCSEVALAIARDNAVSLGLAERIHFYQGNWWSPLTYLKGQVRAMVANPPYIPTTDLSQLQPEVILHEPHLALDGGKDGLNHIRHLVEVSSDYLCSGGIWLIEMMAGQAQSVAHLLQAKGDYHQIQILPDLAGIERFALAYRR